MNQPTKKKILIALPNSGSGGDTQCLLNLLFAASDNQFSFYFLVNQIGVLHEQFKTFGQVGTFPPDRNPLFRRILRRISVPFYNWIKTSYFRFAAKRISPDLVYINTVNYNELTRALVSLHYNYIIHPHEVDFVVTHRIDAKWLSDVLNRAKKVITPAMAASHFYHDIFGIAYNKIILLHATVSHAYLHQECDWDLRQKLKITDDVIIIGMSGSLIYRKGVDLFIRTAEILLRETGQKTVFVWMGGDPAVHTSDATLGPLWKMVEELNLQQQCFFLPHQTSVCGFFKSIDLFVLPSRIEAFPLVVLEAMLFEKPVVAMDVGGVREVVDSDTGYLVKDRTPEGLAEGILHFINNPNLRAITGKNGKKRVMENFEARVQAQKWLHILNSI